MTAEESWQGCPYSFFLPSLFPLYVAFRESALMCSVWNYRCTCVYTYDMHLFLKDLEEMEYSVPFFFSPVFGEDGEVPY